MKHFAGKIITSVCCVTHKIVCRNVLHYKPKCKFQIQPELETRRRKLNLTNESSEQFHDSLEEDCRSVSEFSKSSKSTSSTSTSSSPNSSTTHSSRSEVFGQTQPARLAKTFRKNDLVNELNKTRTVNNSVRVPVVETRKIKGKNSAPKVNSWIDPKSVKGTPNDEKKVKEWIKQKDRETKEKREEAKKKKKEEETRKRDDYEMKQQLQKKNFEQWESKKKEILERKIKQSEELKARKKEKEREHAEKLQYSEKAFQNWKLRKDERIKEESKTKRQQQKETMEEKARLNEEKERDQRKAFERWCQNQKGVEQKKRAEQRKIKEAEEELELLQEYRRQDAEEEYIQWKKEKTFHHSSSQRPVTHPLGWAPAGKSDGRHRMPPNQRPTSPGEPLSKTLATLQNEPTYHRRLKTIEVCCRKISFWCHCPSVDCSLKETGSPYDLQRSHDHPLGASTPKSSPTFLRNQYGYGDASNGRISPSLNLSRHTTPVSSRPSTPRRR